MPAPSRLTPDVTERVVSLIRVGVPLAIAADLVGVSERTLYAWLERGNPDRRAKRDAPHRAFRAAVERARRERYASLVGIISNAARKGSWRAAIALLEREFGAARAAGPEGDHGEPGGPAAPVVDDQLGPDGDPL